MLYHLNLYVPDYLLYQVPSGTIRLTYTNHAHFASQNDRYGSIPIFSHLDLDNCEIFELETDEQGKLYKFVCRLQLNQNFDVCFAVAIHPWKYSVKTVWLNERRDNHRTLDKRKYVMSP